MIIYIIFICREMQNRWYDVYEILFDEYPNERCWKLIYPVVTAPNETRNSLNSVFTSAIVNFIQNDAIVDQTSHSTFQAEDLLKSKTALFLISRDEGSVYDAMITAIVDQLYSILTDIAERQGGTLDRKVSFILDEFGNLAALSDVQKKLTLSRARGITWHFVVQSLEQLSLVYGDKSVRRLLLKIVIISSIFIRRTSNWLSIFLNYVVKRGRK